MSIKEFVKGLKNEPYKIFVEELLKKYKVDKEQDMDCYDIVAGGTLNGEWFSLEKVFDVIKEVEEQYDFD